MQSFDTVTLRVFLAVARLGSIGAAARSEHIAVSAASRRISELEADLDVVLVSRTSTGVGLTSAGHVFVRHCEHLLGEYADIRADLKRFAAGQAGDFRIGVITWAMSGSLPPIIAHFKKKHPAVHVTVQEIYTSEGIRYLREDLADLVIIYDSVNPEGYETLLFKKDQVWLIGCKEHPLFQQHTDQKPIKYGETLGYEHISFHEGGLLDELVSEARRKENISAQYDTKVLRVNSLIRCVEAGFGLGVITGSDLRPFLNQRNLKAIPLADAWAKRNIICVFPKAQAASPVLSSFLQCMDEANFGDNSSNQV